MSEVDQNEAVPDADVEEEAIYIKKEITVDMDNPVDGDPPKPASAETADIEEEHSVVPVDDDRTEDQVPDITGTENVDPMTTSMDGIEDLPTNEEAQVTGDGEAAAVGTLAEQHVEESNTALSEEPALVDDNVKVEVYNTEGEAPPEEGKTFIELETIAETPAEEVADIDEKPAVVEEGVEESKNADEQIPPPEATPAPDDEQKEFELQAPPEGKRPRTPNELDNLVSEERLDADQSKEDVLPSEENEVAAVERKQSQETAATSENLKSGPQTPKSTQGSVPPTPKSAKSETATTPTRSVPQTPKADEAASTPTRSVPQTPKADETASTPTRSVPQTPKADETASTPTRSVPQTPKADETASTPTRSVPQTPKTDEIAGTPTRSLSQISKADETASTPTRSAPQTPKADETFSTPTGSVPQTPKTASEEAFRTPVGSVPPTPRSVEEAPGTPGSVPPTPKETSQEAQQGTVPSTPKSTAGSVPPTPKLSNEVPRKSSVPSTPSAKVETPKVTTPSITTPKTTGTPKSNAAFSFDETPPTPKDTETSPTPVKRTTRAGRTAKTAKTPKRKTSNTEETIPVIEEAAHEPIAETEPTAAVEEEPLKTVENDAVENEPQPEPVDEEPKVVEVEAMPTEEEPEAVEEQPEADERPPPEEPETEALQSEEPPREHFEEEKVDEAISKTPEKVEEVERRSPIRARASSPSPPPRRTRPLSPSPERRPLRDYTSYDQDSYRQLPPPRIPTTTSFSSWGAPDRTTYTPVSPFVTNPYKYRNEYTASCNYRPNNSYLSQFDDIVNTGPFSSALYSTTRLIERSRSRTRERRQAMRSVRSASNYYRYTSQYPAPQRTREYSTPPSREYSRPPSRSGSFISFMEYSGSKNGELSRNASRSSIHDSAVALSRSSSRDMFYGGGRLSRVDSYVRDLHTPYEYEMPSSYERYRSSSRSGGYSTVSGYTSYNSSPYIETDTTRRFKRYQYDVTPMVMSMYEGRIGHLERSLSREKLTKDRLRFEYNQLSNKLNQAMRQMDLLRSNSYSSIRSSSQPRTNVYTHFYPYY